MIRFIISFIVIFFSLFVALKRPKYFLVLVPFLPFSGFMFSDVDAMNRSQFIYTGLTEFIVMLTFLRKKLNDKTSIFLFILPLMSLPSLLMANEHIFLSIYLVLLLSISAYMYVFQLENIKFILQHNIIDITLVILVVLGFFGKIYSAYMGITELGNDVPFLIAFFFARDGAIAGGNYVTQLMFTILPLTKNTKVIVLCTFFQLITFSRGSILCLTIYWLWQVAVSNQRVKKIVIISLTLIAVYLTLNIFQGQITEAVLGFAQERLIAHKGTDIATRYENESRFELFDDALDIAKKTVYLGNGLGGFYYGQLLLGRDSDSSASNAHNLYLTLLAEGGIFILLGYLSLFAITFFTTIRKKKFDALLATIILLIYFFFSGEFYEATRYTTAGPYYFFIFLLAYINYSGVASAEPDKKYILV